MPHLVEVWEENKEAGLVVLAVSDEPKGLVQKFLKDFGVTYPVGAGCRAGRDYGVRGIPTSFLIDHEGRVLWRGHPMQSDWERMLPSALKRAKAASLVWDPGPRDELLERAVEQAQEQDYDDAWRECERMRKRYEDEPEKLQLVEAFQKDLLDFAESKAAEPLADAERGCYYLAVTRLDELQDAFKGLPPADEWRDTVRAWKRDREVRKMMDWDEERVEALEIIRGGNRGKGIQILRKLHEDAEGTPLAQTIAEDIDRV